MGANNHANLILLEESIDNIRSVAHDVIDSCGVTNCILLHAEYLIRGCGVTPQDIHTHLLNCVSDVAQVNPKRSLNFINIF